MCSPSCSFSPCSKSAASPCRAFCAGNTYHRSPDASSRAKCPICEEVKFYSEAAKRYEAEIKKLVQAMPEVKAGLVIDRRDNYGKLADMILAEVLKENGKRGLVDAGWRPTWDMKKMGF